jgi:hypothetical protein
MPRPHLRKMAPVGRQNFHRIQAFRCGNDCGVRESKVEVRVLLHDHICANDVLRLQRLDRKLTIGDCANERGFSIW